MFPFGGYYESCYGHSCTFLLEYMCPENGILELFHHNSETSRAPRRIRDMAHWREKIKGKARHMIVVFSVSKCSQKEK